MKERRWGLGGFGVFGRKSKFRERRSKESDKLG